MFDLDFSDIFQKLPPILQGAAALGVGAAAAYAVYRGLQSRVGNVAADSAVMETAQLAAELADAKVRQDLTDVIRIARESIEQRIDQLGTGLRNEVKAVAEKDSAGRALIFQRLEDVNRRIHDLEMTVERLRPRR